MEILDHDFENNALKLLGFTCSFELLNSLVTGIIAYGLAAGQYLLL